MGCSTGKRILLVARRHGFHERFRSAFSSAGPGLGGLPWGMAAWPVAPPGLDDLVMDSAEPEEAEECVRQALRDRKPYALVAVDFEVPYCQSVDLVHRLWKADSNLHIFGCVSNHEDMWNYISSQLESPDHFSFVRDAFEPVEIRQLVAMQLDRRVLEDRLYQRDRELDLARAGVERAQQDAREARRIKTEFLANVTHEVRTPMNAILGFTGLLLKDPLAPECLEKVRYIHEAGHSLLRLIENILDFSQLVEGKLALEPVPFRAETVLDEVLEAVQPAVRDKGLEITCHAEEAVPACLLGDPARFRQILIQLVNNAVKFTLRGAIQVRVALDEETETTVMLRTVVSDTGVGIPPERQEIIFESFAQADGSATRQFGGLGLGLTLAKQLVDLMGGQIGFHSAVNEGSSFWVVVPFEKHAAPEGKPETDPGARKSLAATPRSKIATDVATRVGAVAPKKCRVLVAEVEPLSRTLLELILTRAGCFVDLVRSGPEALAMLQCNAYDLAFVNARLPRIDGVDVIRAIRSKQAGSESPLRIIALATGDPPVEHQECVEVGANDVIAKPVNPDALLAAVGRQLPGLLETSETEDTSQGRSAGSGLSGLLEESVRGLHWALDAPDFEGMERHAERLKNLAAQAGSEVVADHAMRVQLAARGRNLHRAAIAIERLDQALQDPSLVAPSYAHATCAP